MDNLEKCLKVTAAFEGGGYDNVSGNFDDMGISAGVLQWCIGQGSLQAKILKPFLGKHGSIDALKIFPDKVDFLVNSSNSAGVSYAASKMHVKVRISLFKSKTVLKEEWKVAWKKFMTLPEVIELQKLACQEVLKKALDLRAAWGMESDRALQWFFDIITQNGSLKGVTKPAYDLAAARKVIMKVNPVCRKEWEKIDLAHPDRKENVILLIASDKRAQLSNSRWYDDVLSRKGTIALGVGVVHGSKVVI